MSIENNIETDVLEQPQYPHNKKGLLTFFWLLSIFPLIFLFYDPSFEEEFSSTQMASKQFVKNDFNRHPAHMRNIAHKPHGSVNVKITPPEGLEISNGEPFTLTGSFNILVDLENARFRWIVPHELAEVIAGELEGDLGDLLSGDQQEVQITVKSFSTENLQIHFEIYGTVNGERRGNITQFNSDSLKPSSPSENQKMKPLFKEKRPRIIF